MSFAKTYKNKLFGGHQPHVIWKSVALPRATLHAQKKPCITYNLHVMTSCRYGVASPTKKLNAQLVLDGVDNISIVRRQAISHLRGGEWYSFGAHRQRHDLGSKIDICHRQANITQTSGGYSQGSGPQLYPNAALNIMTHITTASGVKETLRYIQYPVAHKAAHI